MGLILRNVVFDIKEYSGPCLEAQISNRGARVFDLHLLLVVEGKVF